jgi:hypothetical protein
MLDLVIPDECVPFIRWQRTRFIQHRVPDPEDVKRGYAKWVAEDFAGMEPHLPARVDAILEIGCGMAAIEVHLKRKYPDAKLWLLDGTGANIVKFDGTDSDVGKGGWNHNLQPYNSREHTEMLLAANGVTVDRWIDIGTKEHLKADLILSMASLGFHYPFATYDVEGFVICDLRRRCEDDRIRSIQANGGKIIFNGPKYERCAWQQKGKT